MSRSAADEAAFVAGLLRTRVRSFGSSRSSGGTAQQRERLFDGWFTAYPGAAESPRRIANALDRPPAALEFAFGA